ncbi:MAG: SMC-Scp complex subunit ScpB [Methanomassiliicoccus sp.]|nr:SMC-Scp complex subunit ScpB [Methanomassiliicoccus sp.]
MELDPVRIVETVLFSSSQPVKVSDMEVQTQLEAAVVRRALKKLQQEYDERGSAMEVAKTGAGYCLIVREQYRPFGRQFAPKEVPDEVLRTAAMIAYHQPILQSDLARSLGSRVYDDVRTLHQLGLVTAKKKGQTFLLTTTKRFCEYFGIEGTSKTAVKKWMEERSRAP